MKKATIIFLCLSMLFLLASCNWEDLPLADRVLEYLEKDNEPVIRRDPTEQKDQKGPKDPEKPEEKGEEKEPEPPEEETASSYEIRLQQQDLQEKDTASPQQIE